MLQMYWILDSLFLIALQCILLLGTLIYYRNWLVIIGVVFLVAIGMITVVGVVGQISFFMPEGSGLWGRKVWPVLIGSLIAVILYLIGYIYFLVSDY